MDNKNVAIEAAEHITNLLKDIGGLFLNMHKINTVITKANYVK